MTSSNKAPWRCILTASSAVAAGLCRDSSMPGLTQVRPPGDRQRPAGYYLPRSTSRVPFARTVLQWFLPLLSGSSVSRAQRRSKLVLWPQSAGFAILWSAKSKL